MLLWLGKTSLSFIFCLGQVSLRGKSSWGLLKFTNFRCQKYMKWAFATCSPGTKSDPCPPWHSRAPVKEKQNQDFFFVTRWSISAGLSNSVSKMLLGSNKFLWPMSASILWSIKYPGNWYQTLPLAVNTLFLSDTKNSEEETFQNSRNIQNISRIPTETVLIGSMYFTSRTAGSFPLPAFDFLLLHRSEPSLSEMLMTRNVSLSPPARTYLGTDIGWKDLLFPYFPLPF